VCDWAVTVWRVLPRASSRISLSVCGERGVGGIGLPWVGGVGGVESVGGFEKVKFGAGYAIEREGESQRMY